MSNIGIQLKFNISQDEIARIQPVIDREYNDLHHWLLDCVKKTIDGELKFYDWERKKQAQENQVSLSLSLSPEYYKRFMKAVVDNNFRTNMQWLLACIEETVKSI